MGSEKLWLDLGGRPLIGHTLVLAAACDLLVVATSPERWDAVRELAAAVAPAVELRLVAGGVRRQDSVRNGLEATEGCSIVVVHDAARPLCPPALLRDVVAAASASGAATAAVPCVDSIKRVDDRGVVVESVPRLGLVRVQTPQAFRRDLLVEAHRRAVEEGREADDDSALVETFSAVVTVAGDPSNIKVTTPDDLLTVRRTLQERVA